MLDLLKLIPDDIDLSGSINPSDFFPINTTGFAFLCFCMGVKSLRINEAGSAEKHFRNAKNNLLCNYMLKFLISPQKTKGTNAIEIWSMSNLAQREYDFISNSIKTTLKNRNITPNYFLDMGVGNGKLTTKIFDLVYKLNPNAKLMINDKSPRMLEIALDNIKLRYPQNHTVRQLKGRVQDMSIHIDEPPKKVLVNASSVLHELRRDEKKQILETLKSISNCIFISDLEGCHDIVDPNSRFLIASVFNFYDSLIYNIINCSDFDLEIGNELILSYLIPEVYGVLFEDYERRGNYHITINDWIELFNQTGWQYVLFQMKFKGYLPSFFTFNIFR